MNAVASPGAAAGSDDTDRRHLTRCVELAEQALAAGDEPFGSALVGPDGTITRVWDKVKVKGHAAEVLEAARAL